MKKFGDEFGREWYVDVKEDDDFRDFGFHQVSDGFVEEVAEVLSTNLGSLIVLPTLVGIMHNKVETGYRDMEGKLWFTDGNCDVRYSGAKTIGEAIAWVKEHATVCTGV